MHYLIDLAKKTVENKLRNPDYPYMFTQVAEIDKERTGGVFVTINKKGQLRGCIGNVISHQLVINNVQEMALQAAFHDPRFPPVQEDELKDLEYEVTIMHPPVLIKDIKEIEVGKHGLIIECDGQKGLLLPQVATEHGWDVITFLKHTCWKAGLDVNAWQYARTKIFKFEGEVIK